MTATETSPFFANTDPFVDLTSHDAYQAGTERVIPLFVLMGQFAAQGGISNALYRSALRVGRDHVASTVNTLVLAYAGASLPLLLFFAQGAIPVHRLITGEVISVEIVRMLVGSIGIVLGGTDAKGASALAEYLRTAVEQMQRLAEMWLEGLREAADRQRKNPDPVYRSRDD